MRNQYVPGKRAALLAMRMSGPLLCCCMFYSISGDAVEDDGYCEAPGDEESVRAREIALAFYSLLFTIGVHATFIPLLTKQAVPAPNGKPWTEAARRAQLRYWAAWDSGGIVFALLYCAFAFVLA